MPPARLLMTAVLTASAKSFSPGSPARIDQPRPAHVAIGHLPAGILDGVVGDEGLVHALVELAVAGFLVQEKEARRCSPAISA